MMNNTDMTIKVLRLPIIIRRILYSIFLNSRRKSFPLLHIRVIPFLILLAVVMLPFRAFSQTQSFAKLISLVHDYGCGGSIEYALLGNPSDYTYYWKHGPKTLKITGLEPGTYTLVVRDLSGCEQEFPTTVLDRRNCAVQITFSEGPTPCEVYVTVAPLDSDPISILSGSATAQISWSDDVSGIYTRLLRKEVVEAGTLAFTYSQIMDGQICCDTTGLIVPGEDWEEAPEGGCVPECDYAITVKETSIKCQILITIIPDSSVLQGMDEPIFIVRWNDGLVTNSLQRLINLYDTYGNDLLLHAQVSVFERYTCSEECRFTLSVEIPGRSECGLGPNPDPENQRVAISEFGTIPGDTSTQYIELLVTGGGECGGYSDLRGIIIDDNNGDLIPAGEFIHKYNRHLIGINQGFIYFAYHEAWAEVPNGSLIVIYNERDAGGVLPPDDPYDADEDHVYVLSYAEAALFRGKTSEWSEEEKVEKYQGVLDEVTWDKILISGPADGIQVRLPSGEYMHGLSTGVTPFTLPVNPFSLWLGELHADAVVCRLDGDSPYDWQEFQCTPYDTTAASPGLPNSEKNASLLAKLLGCEEELPTGEEESPSTIKSVEVTVDADTSFYGSSGQLITYTITVTNTGNTVLIGLEVKDDASGFSIVIKELLPCETRTFVSTHEVDCKWLANTDGVTNTVTVSGEATAIDSVHVTNQSINLVLVKRDSSSFIEGEFTVRFSLKLDNISPNEATGVSVEDYLPSDGYSSVSNISHGGTIISSTGGTTLIRWEDLVVGAESDLNLSFDAILEPGGTHENCAEIVGSDQYNIQAPPCNTTPTGLSSCVEPDTCQLSASIVDVDYDDNGTPTDPSDDEVYFEILVTAPVGITGDWNINGTSAGNFEGDFDVPESIGPFPVGFEDEWLYIEAKGDIPCEGTILITSPAVLGDFVWYDTDLDGLQDSGEEGIPGIEVVLKQSTTTIATTTTDSTGHYLFTNLAPGDYTISINQAATNWETVDSISFQIALLVGITQISGNAGFVLSGYGATGSPTDKCVRSSFQASNQFLSIEQSLDSDYEYRIRWNVKNTTTNPAYEKIMQLRYNTTATYTGTDIGIPYTLPQIATTSPGSEYTSSVFWGLSGTYHLILAPASGNSSANVNCYFDNFRLQRRTNFLVPTTQNVGSDESIDSDVNTSGVSGAVTLESGEIYLDLDAGFVHGIELLGGNFPEESQVIAAEMPGQDALLVYPNPFTAETCRLRLGSAAEGKGRITIYSALSQQILEVNTDLVFGSNDMELQLPESLTAGVYLVKVQFPSGKILTQKITKIRL